ncbi:hypothetical protein GCM10027020_22290 [Nocardioides salsibiostraticola]
MAGLALTLSAFAITPAATAASSALVINEVYGGGGNNGAPFDADFVELKNNGTSAVSLDGLAIQYRSSGGSSGGVAAINGSVEPGATFLVQVGTPGSNGSPLPSPDLVTTQALAMSGSNGQVFLLPDTTAYAGPAGDIAGSAAVVDMVGYGSATTFETAATAGLSNTTSAERTAVDADDNSSEFAAGAPTPTPSGADPDPDPDPEPVEVSIAEIQGTGAASPLVGDDVVTRGVVTAAFPEGGFNGFYLQTPGAGTPEASDAVYVFGSAFVGDVAVGDYVEVTGEVAEFSGLTELLPATDGITVLEESVETPVAETVLPVAADREVHEGELFAPTEDYTVTNTFSTNQFGEVGLARGNKPLIQPTDVEDAQTGDIARVEADNADRAVTLDDGASINFLPFGGGDNQDIPLPYLSPENPIRVGAPATFTAPVVLDYRFSTWRYQPQTQVTASDDGPATFENTRTDAPEEVGGDVRLATFNVLNYFNTTGEAYELASGDTCSYYTDRDDNRVTVNRCGGDGPRGAAQDDDLERQQAKIVAAINALDADIVSLEEIENSIALGEADRDDALSALVDALNDAAGSDVWDFVPTPGPEGLPALEDQDVIRTAFIFKPAAIDLVGASEVLVGSPAFSNAREPLAQAFKLAGGEDEDAFTVVVNHFKSKGSGANDGTGQGNANPDRIAQATALNTFAEEFAADRGTEEIFLAGDFNAYTQEDPMQVLYDAGYTNLESDTPGEVTYSFSGLSGSLDHVLANDAAVELVTGVDIWNINSGESVAFEYSRTNYNVTDFYAPGPFRASDHDPEVIGLDLPDVAEPPAEVAVSAEKTKTRFGQAATVPITVTGDAADGRVEIRGDDGAVLGQAPVAGGTAEVELAAKSLRPGRYTLDVVYLEGDQTVAAGKVRVIVRKAKSSVTARTAPSKVREDKTRALLKITVEADGVRPNGFVKIRVPGHGVRVTKVRNGNAKLRLPRFNRPGQKSVGIRYNGNTTVGESFTRFRLTVVR